MNKWLLSLFILFSSCLNAYEYKLSIAAITKGEDLYLKEWIDYHMKMGVDHFYLYDNNDDDSTLKALQHYIEDGVVELTAWPNKWPKERFFEGCQVYAYQNALKRAAYHTDWLAIIDTDEFLVPIKDKTLTEVLNNYYNNHGFIYVNWRMFGTSYEYVEPGEPLLPKLTRCSTLSYRGNIWGKTICRPELATTVLNVHFVETIYPYLNGSGTFHKEEEHKSDLLILNHYALRDENFLRNVKIPRYIKMWNFEETEEEMLEKFHKLNEDYSVEENYRIIELLTAPSFL